MNTVCTIYLLGQMRVQQGAHTTHHFRTQRARSLLAYLAYHLHIPQDREVLIGMLWPDYSPDRGRNCLSIELTSLRHLLEPPGVAKGTIILADRYTVQLNPALVTTDVGDLTGSLDRAARTRDAAERTSLLARAIDLYTGRLLPGLYEEWIDTEQMLLEGRICAAINQLCTLLQHDGDVNRALDYALIALRIDPKCIAAHQKVIDLHLACGDIVGANRQREALRQLLREQGIETHQAVVTSVQCVPQVITRMG
jgi:DNA-binding SARP family transcriptional activator